MMTSKVLILISAISVCFATIAVANEIVQDESTAQETSVQQDSLFNKETPENKAPEGLRKRCPVPSAAGRRFEIIRRLRQAEKNQKQQNLDLALTTTKLAELEKQRDAEKITDSTPTNQLTRWQRNLLTEIARAKIRKEDLTLDSAVTKTLIEQLKIVLAANGGSTDTSSTDNQNDQNLLNNQIKQAQDNQERIITQLASVTTQLEQLESQKTAQNINTDNGVSSLTVAQRVLLKQIERTKERKFELTLQSALTNTMIEQLQLQLNAISAGTTSAGTAISAGTTSVGTATSAGTTSAGTATSAGTTSAGTATSAGTNPASTVTSGDTTSASTATSANTTPTNSADSAIDANSGSTENSS